ncbi:hypothetical protein SB379_12435 [Burkholderia multivorans]|uniref:hypothetical protein n=1 Tax=Burkholderia multivorans TaxID=87883 RepID=UPI0015E71528|nr:hypothetical protein [Burkholderia multivorans]MBR8017338.1 hypothetical protein [Burkholderia multivorans]MEB2512711.1 hypothetical protein [Burkholderia multivorans]MEB2522279.1 hypothetical protein [Burkholderia multivorans]MEB2576839.1 hypothetical protein [Burkholderia multivorans]MEB2593553.1 hypothetical protein [Burkholderia multivorans]
MSVPTTFGAKNGFSVNPSISSSASVSGPRRTCALGESCALPSLCALRQIVDEVSSGLGDPPHDDHAIAFLALLSGRVTPAQHAIPCRRSTLPMRSAATR